MKGRLHVLAAALLLLAGGVVQAQFNYTTNGGAISITKYTGSCTSVTIPGTIDGLPVTSIGNNAFQNNTSLISVSIPSSVTSIGDYAFWYCSSLTSISIPNSVSFMGIYVFEYCTGLTNVTIGSGVNRIGNYTFASCPNLTAITVDALNSTYSSAGGVLFDRSQANLIAFPGGKAGGYAVPGSVTNIVGSAFASCAGLASVTVPNSVLNIGSDAFNGCSGLTNVAMGTGVINIGDYAFYSCAGVTSVAIPNSVASMGIYVFTYCTNLASVTIGTGVKRIGSYTFAACQKLTAITVDPLNSAYSSAAGVLFDKSQATLIQFPAGKSGNYLIPGTVTNIVAYAFWSCAGLTGVTLPDSVLTIGTYSFRYDAGLTNLTMGAGVISIGDYAFSYCTGLIGAAIPNGVTNLGIYVFENCTGLTNVAIGTGIARIGNATFSGCAALTSISVDPLNFAYSSASGVLFDKSQSTLIQFPGGRAGNYTVPNSVTNIAGSAFASCASLASVTIPNSTLNIGSDAFTSCAGLTNILIGGGVTSIGDYAFSHCTSLAAVAIPNNVTNLGVYVFASCDRLNNVTIGSGVKRIGNYTFSSCPNLTAITVDPSNSSYSSTSGVLFDKSQATLIQFPGGKGGSYAIPNSVNNIGGYAFWSCSGLTSVTVGVSVTSIGDYAFWYCTSLASVSIPNNVTNVGVYVFANCAGLTNATIGSGVRRIGNYTFSSCASLSAIAVDPSNSSYSSADGVLFDKSQATLIQFPGGQTGGYTVPNSATNIAASAFSACARLTSVTIPNSVLSIGSDAFASCASLAKAVIGTGVTSIGAAAFTNGHNLRSVYFKGDAPVAESSVFGSDSTATIYYLPGTACWGTTFSGRPTVLWDPQVQTAGASFGVRTNRFGFTITGSGGLIIVVEGCTDLADPIWSPLATNTLTGGSSYFSDAQWINHPARFYRLRSP